MIALHQRKKRKEAEVTARITAVLADVGPLLRIEHCHIEVTEYSASSGRVTVRIDASCPDCELSPATFMPGIEAHLRQRVPEVREVRVIGQ
jgi:Fe-S cluster biogenesis protein NfuA